MTSSRRFGALSVGAFLIGALLGGGGSACGKSSADCNEVISVFQRDRPAFAAPADASTADDPQAHKLRAAAAETLANELAAVTSATRRAAIDAEVTAARDYAAAESELASALEAAEIVGKRASPSLRPSKTGESAALDAEAKSLEALCKGAGADAGAGAGARALAAECARVGAVLQGLGPAGGDADKLDAVAKELAALKLDDERLRANVAALVTRIGGTANVLRAADETGRAVRAALSAVDAAAKHLAAAQGKEMQSANDLRSACGR